MIYLNKLKEYERARNYLEKALEISPNYVSALLNLAILLYKHFNEKEKASKLFSKAKALDQKNISGSIDDWMKSNII
jgi:tetratricopeptide (TPR) repeat protein